MLVTYLDRLCLGDVVVTDHSLCYHATWYNNTFNSSARYYIRHYNYVELYFHIGGGDSSYIYYLIKYLVGDYDVVAQFLELLISN